MKRVLVIHNNLEINFKDVCQRTSVIEVLKIVDYSPRLVRRGDSIQPIQIKVKKLEIKELKYEDTSYYYALEDGDNNKMYLIAQSLIIGKVLGIPMEKTLQLIKETYE